MLGVVVVGSGCYGRRCSNCPDGLAFPGSFSLGSVGSVRIDHAAAG